METKNELYEIIKTELDVFFKEGATVENCDKKAFLEAITHILVTTGYEKKIVSEKETAKVIYGSLYKTACLMKDKKLTIHAEAFRSMAKDVYDVDIKQYPYKEKVKEPFGEFWAVYYIHNGQECRCLFGNEELADNFIKTLKEKEDEQGKKD